MTIPVTIGATETATKGLGENMEAILRKYSIFSLQKDSYTCNITHNTESTAV
jgi:hypothetical protein